MKHALITGITGQDGSYLAELLLEREVIFSEDVQNILGDRPFHAKEEKQNSVGQSNETEKLTDTEEPIKEQ